MAKPSPTLNCLETEHPEIGPFETVAGKIRGSHQRARILTVLLDSSGTERTGDNYRRKLKMIRRITSLALGIAIAAMATTAFAQDE